MRNIKSGRLGVERQKLKKHKREGRRERKSDIRRTLKSNTFIVKIASQIIFSPSEKVPIYLSLGKLFQCSYPCPFTLSGTLSKGIFWPFRDSIFMFTGGRRCGDRISPAFGSVVNAVVIVGHVLRFGSYVPAHCLHTHSLTPLQCCSSSQTVLSRIKTRLTLSTQGQEQPETETHIDHLCHSATSEVGNERLLSCFHLPLPFAQEMWPSQCLC